MPPSPVVCVWSPWPLHADAVAEVLREGGVPAGVVPSSGAVPGLLVAEAIRFDDLGLVRARARAGRSTVVWGGTLPVPRVAALRVAGAAAYVPMLEHPHQLVGVVTDVLSGVPVEWAPDPEPMGQLTARERAVARAYLVDHGGWGRAQVAEALGISERTLKVHVANIRAKAGHRGTHTREGLRRALTVRGWLAESGNRQSS